MYYKLKTSFLEEKLSDALEDDAFDLSLLESSSQLDGLLSASTSEMVLPDVTRLTSDDSTILTNQTTTNSSPPETNQNRSHHTSPPAAVNSFYSEPCITEFEAEQSDSFNEKAWGKELNRTTSIPVESSHDSQASSSGMSLRKTMSDKLFRNSSFAKRNPRKSLSRASLSASQASIGSGHSSSQRESLPDLETILSQKSMQIKDSDANASHESVADHSVASNTLVGGKTNSNLINSIDYEWLNRCDQDNRINTNDNDGVLTASQTMPTITMRQTYGLSNINADVLRTLEPAPLSIQSKSNSTSVKCMPLANRNDDDDEEIANSEDESTNNNKVQIRSIRESMNKRKRSSVDEVPVIALNGSADARETANGEKGSSAARASVERKVVKAKRVAKKSVVTQPMVSRRSARPRKSPKALTETAPLNDSDDDNEEDPFAFDDSDADPDFGEELKKRHPNGCDSGASSSESGQVVDDASGSTKKEKKTKTRKVSVKVTRKRAAKQPSIKPDPVRKVRRVVAARSKAVDQDANVDNVAEETPDDYLMEFGIDNVKSVPRIAAGELAKNTQRFTEYVHNSAALLMAGEVKPTKKSMPSVSKPLTTKNSVAKDKLEKRVAAGTVNENFVRLNLRKKVFVRGKKTVNFSRYKKQQWRNKKAAALTGPDMDMGGCDGGFLVCFQCGLAGHFAQNCKIKSESLFRWHSNRSNFIRALRFR